MRQGASWQCTMCAYRACCPLNPTVQPQVSRDVSFSDSWLFPATSSLFSKCRFNSFFGGGGGGDGGIEIQTLLKRMKFWLFSGDISRISVLGIHSIQAETVSCFSASCAVLTPTRVIYIHHQLCHLVSALSSIKKFLFYTCRHLFICLLFYTNANHYWNES